MLKGFTYLQRPGLCLLGLFTLWTVPALSAADQSGQVTIGRARFTVITPELIRLEYARTGHFVDDPSWFAINRTARFTKATIRQDAGTLSVDTGSIHLTYHDTGKPFTPDNLTATIRRDPASAVNWQPGQSNPGNLGGTLCTLDGVSKAVPLGEGILSRDGWYLLDDSHSGLFTADWVRSRPDEGNLDWYLFGYGANYRAALASLTTVGGPIPLPRKYTLGIWFSRYWEFTGEGFKQIVEEYASHGFPLDVLVMDMGWHLNAVSASLEKKVNTWTGYTWDKALIPDPSALLAWLHQQGLHVTLNDHPAEGVQPHEEMYADFMRAMGQDPGTGKTIPFDAGSKPYLDKFFAFTHAPREKEGVDFWWLDWQQYRKTRSIPDLDNLRLLNWYNYQRTATANQRGESFSRWAGWGDHRYPIHFSGDADTGWKMLTAEVPFTSTAGNVGAFFWSHDIGGHMGGRNEESYARWCQFGALSAALRSHSTHDATTDRRPWNYPDWAQASMKESFGLRSRLMPYLYSAMQRAATESVPFLRPLYIDFPTTETAYHQSQEFLFGDQLLVAPISSPGVGPRRIAAQSVWFPPTADAWFDFFTGERFNPGEHAVATAPIDSFPLYVRSGIPLPMQPFTQRPGTAPLKTLTLRCYPGREGVTGTTTLYEDDGLTTAYRSGQSAITPLSYIRHNDDITVTVGATTGTFTAQPQTRAIIIELPCTQAGATCAGADLTYEPATFTTRVSLPVAPIGSQRTVTIHAKEMPQNQVNSTAIDSRLQKLLGQPFARWAASEESKSAGPALLSMVSAVRGVALLPVNQHPYALGDKTAVTYFHNHHTLPESLTLTIADQAPRTLTITAGQPVATSPQTTPHPLTLTVPVSLSGLPDNLPVLHASFSRSLPPSANLATKAVAEASTGDGKRAIDSSIDGYPGDQSCEWVTTHEKANAWIKLTWPAPTAMNRVLLYDRPNLADQVESGTLEFSDGTRIDVPSLPNDGSEPGVITFPNKTCTWLKFTVTQASQKTENIGLAELAVMNETKP